MVDFMQRLLLWVDYGYVMQSFFYYLYFMVMKKIFMQGI